MNVLLLRAQEDSRRTAARLNEMGHQALISPLIEIVGLDAAVPQEHFDLVIATSAHAFASMIHAPAHLANIPLALVGTRTAERAQAVGFSNIIHVADDQDSLTQSLCGGTPSSVLYLAGHDRKIALEDALAQHRFDVKVVVTYEARARNHLSDKALNALRSGTLDAALHYSHRSAALFLAALHDAPLRKAASPLTHIAISGDAAEPLQEAGFACRIADQPNEAVMLNILSSVP